MTDFPSTSPVPAANHWSELQRNIATWAAYNFGSMQEAWQPMLGVIEEVGEFYANLDEKTIDWGRYSGLSAGLIIHTSPGRTIEQSKLELEDAIADQAIYALNLAAKCGIDFGQDIIATGNIAQHFTEREVIGFLATGCQVVLKHSQGIRGMNFEERRHRMTVVLNLWHRWCLQKIEVFKLEEFSVIVMRVWAKVSKRDWRKNPEDANKVVEQSENNTLCEYRNCKIAGATMYHSPGSHVGSYLCDKHRKVAIATDMNIALITNPIRHAYHKFTINGKKFILPNEWNAFNISRITIHESAKWTVKDIMINGKSQFSPGPHDMPGEIFAPCIDMGLVLDVMQRRMSFEIDAVYSGPTTDNLTIELEGHGILAEVPAHDPPEIDYDKVMDEATDGSPHGSSE